MKAALNNMPKYPDLQIIRFTPRDKGDPIPSFVLEVVFDSFDGASPDELRELSLAGLEGHYYWKEDRSQFNWGASGPDILTLLVEFGVALAAGRVDSIIERLATKWRDRSEPAAYRASADSADSAWFFFNRLLKDIYNEDHAEASSIELIRGSWQIKATGSRGKYLGYVNESGRIAYVSYNPSDKGKTRV
jgi:hypothetical protein